MKADKDGYTVHTTMPTVILFAVLMFLSGRGCAQKLLWRIEIHGLDTVAVGPAGDIDSAFVRWSLRGKALRECKWDLKWKQDEVTSLYAERDACWEVVNASKVLMDKMRENEEALNDRANKWQRKAKRRKPWLFFGLGAATLYVVQQQVK